MMIFSVARRYRAILIIIILQRTIVVVRRQDDFSSQKERVKEANISERLLLCMQYNKKIQRVSFFTRCTRGVYKSIDG